jgi:hypothetical protein
MNTFGNAADRHSVNGSQLAKHTTGICPGSAPRQYGCTHPNSTQETPLIFLLMAEATSMPAALTARPRSTTSSSTASPMAPYTSSGSMIVGRDLPAASRKVGSSILVAAGGRASRECRGFGSVRLRCRSRRRRGKEPTGAHRSDGENGDRDWGRRAVVVGQEAAHLKETLGKD